MPTSKTVAIAAPKLEIVEFLLEGTAPLVIHRFSHKTKLEMKQKREDGKPASSRRTREAQLGEDLFNAARYRSPEGWDGGCGRAWRGDAGTGTQ